ncbi:LacI family DNA-binding transcriptional regulator [Clostridium sp. HMP27]|uniref:LacI family DNA-binding transcriptional regulator n=1 Tax=Clostridium sp. HMP27 TaxID=1487921 RepID=UPI00052B8AFF|nr:LacI family DNA-binding transcriptional regulator [Clostridium sp. HMP27]KGK86979.1 LacI family transcriptional regulator [Clostridium sp. HMP27]
MSKITIKEVAERANVSTATVSRVLNNNYPVSDEVRDKVLKVVSELNYQPNGIARSLKNNKTNLIGIIVADISNPFFMKVGRGIESIVSKEGYNLIFCSTDESPDKEKKLLNMMAEKMVDGIIISPCSIDTVTVKNIMATGVKVVLVDRKFDDVTVDYIATDNFNGSFLLTESLIKKGHKDIAIINGHLDVSTAEERFNGYKAAMDRYGLEIDKDFILSGNYSTDIAFDETMKLIKRGKLPTAMLAANNSMAEGVMKVFKSEKIRIPEDISLVSFGEITNQEFIEPKITCIKQNPILMGQKSGEVILDKLKGKSSHNNFKEIVLVNEFCEGNSIKSLI